MVGWEEDKINIWNIWNIKESEKIMELQRQEKRTFYTARITKSQVVAETKDSILVNVDKKGNKVWINKKFAKASLYTNFINLSFVKEFEYNGYNQNNENDTITGEELIKFLDAKCSDDLETKKTK